MITGTDTFMKLPTMWNLITDKSPLASRAVEVLKSDEERRRGCAICYVTQEDEEIAVAGKIYDAIF